MALFYILEPDVLYPLSLNHSDQRPDNQIMEIAGISPFLFPIYGNFLLYLPDSGLLYEK